MHVDPVVQSLWRLWAGEGDQVSRWALVIDGLTADFGDYVGLDLTTGLFTFVSVDRIERMITEGQDPWLTPLRQTMKPARLMRVILHERVQQHLTDADFEAFATRLKAHLNRNAVVLQEVRGEDIRHWYHEKTYVKHDQGSLTGSCLRYEEAQPWMDIFTTNPEQISMLIGVTPQGQLAARSLIWQTVDGVPVRDSIFGRSEVRKQIEAHAEAQKWVASVRCFSGNGGHYVRLDNPFHANYPSMDTFRCLDPDTGLFTVGYGNFDTYIDVSDTMGGKDMSRYAHKNRREVELAASQLVFDQEQAAQEALSL